MKRESAAVEAVDEEVRKLLFLLDSLIRLSKRSQRELERELGFGNGVLSKILAGRISPKLQHVLLIANAIELTPAELFSLAYPVRPRKEESPLAQQLRAAEGWQHENGKAAHSVTLSDDELERRIEAVVERVLRRRGA